MTRRRHESIIPLSHDHREALALAFRLLHPSPPGPATAMTPPSTPASRAAEVLEFFTTHLAGHFRAEEDVLFPAIAAHLSPHESTAMLLRDLVADHRQLEALRDRIANALSASERDGETVLTLPLRNFADTLERHVRREERELFVEFSTIITDAEATILAPRIRDVLSARPPAACRTDGQSKM